jgi:hypothetical protein
MTAQSGRTFPASKVVAPKTPPVSLSLLAGGLRGHENWSACTVEPKLLIRDFLWLEVGWKCYQFCLGTVAGAELGRNAPGIREASIAGI